jgi:hypothetical protein
MIFVFNGLNNAGRIPLPRKADEFIPAKLERTKKAVFQFCKAAERSRIGIIQ